MDKDRYSSSVALNISQSFHLTIWLFQFITGVTFKWDYVIRCSFAMLVWIGLWTKLRTY